MSNMVQLKIYLLFPNLSLSGMKNQNVLRTFRNSASNSDSGFHEAPKAHFISTIQTYDITLYLNVKTFGRLMRKLNFV